MEEVADLNETDTPLRQQVQFCKLCDAPTSSYCKSCCSTYYCCREHQKSHWKIHKNECYPVMVVKDSNLRRLLVAAKDLKQGQKILEEVPILVTPNTRSPNGITCLGCCKKLSPSTIAPCIRCGWPLCGVQCDMESLHRNNECEIFEEQNILSSMGNLGNSYQTLCEIGVLRILLLKNRQPIIWKRLMELDSFKEIRQRIVENMFSVTSIVRFIREDVKMDVDDDLIDTAFGILRGNSFDTSDYAGFIQCCSDEVRCATVIFPTAILPGVNCIPNAYYSIVGRQDGNFKIYCVATVDIGKDEPISMPYEDDMTGTFLRRQVKSSVFYQNCKCKLCADPTEYFTYISSTKCIECKDGNMVAINPLSTNMDSEWKCENCNSIITHLEMLDTIHTAKVKLQSCVNQTTLEESLKSIRGVTNTLLHENHFLVLQTEMEICRRILSVIGFYEIKNIKSDVSSILQNLMEISQHLLSVADLLRPGYNRTRGRLLYCLQFGLLVSILNEQGQQEGQQLSDAKQIKKRLKMEQLLKLQKEAEIILALEVDESSEECQMLRTLRGELKMAVQTIH